MVFYLPQEMSILCSVEAGKPVRCLAQMMLYMKRATNYQEETYHG
jgi:hypothetical protein